MTKVNARTLFASALAVAVTSQAFAGNGGPKKDPALNGVTMLPKRRSTSATRSAKRWIRRSMPLSAPCIQFG
jgi:hypothetical protein